MSSKEVLAKLNQLGELYGCVLYWISNEQDKLNTQFSHFGVTIKNLRDNYAAIEELKYEDKRFSKRLSEQISHWSKTQDQFKDLDNNFTLMLKDSELIHSRIGNLDGSTKEIEKEAQVLKREREIIEAELASLNENVDDFLTRVNLASDESTENKKKLDLIDEKVTNIESNVKNIEVGISEEKTKMERRITQISGKLSQLSGLLNDAKKRINTLDQKSDILSNTCKGLGVETVKLKDELNGLRSNVDDEIVELKKSSLTVTKSLVFVKWISAINLLLIIGSILWVTW